MLKQDIVITFPYLQLQLPNINNSLLLEPETVNTSFIQDAKDTTTEAVKKFVIGVHDKLYREVAASSLPSFAQSGNAFILGQIRFYAIDRVVFTSEPWRVDSANKLSDKFTEDVERLLFVSIFTIIKDVLQHNPVLIKLTDEDIEVPVTLIYEGNYRWTLPLTNVQLKQERGKAIKIRYGNHLHQALYLIERNKNYNKDDISIETLTSLEKLELIDPTYSVILEKGKQVLEALNKFKPDEQPDLVPHFAAELLEANNIDANSPVNKYAIENEYIREENQKTVDMVTAHTFTVRVTVITDKGKEWLKAHSLEILKKNCTKSRRKLLIPYMPLEYLSTFLTSDEAEEREAAKQRMDELVSEQGENM